MSENEEQKTSSGAHPSDSEAGEGAGSQEATPPLVDAMAQTFKDRAQQARREAEGTASASEQARLNKHADELDAKAIATVEKPSTLGSFDQA